MIIHLRCTVSIASFFASPFASTAHAADNAEDLAKKLSNLVAALISVPLQYNYDYHYGYVEKGHKSYLNFQPVVPISISDGWNVISRTILSVVSQSNVSIPSQVMTGRVSNGRYL